MFRYQPERITVGTCYRYTKSNIDGTFPAIVSVYVASRTHIDVIKREPYSEVLAYVQADFDWDVFGVTNIHSWHVVEGGHLSGQAGGQWIGDTFTMYIGPGIFPVKVTPPMFNYNFDLSDLNMMYRHLDNPEADIDFSIIEPNWELLMAQTVNPVGEHANMVLFKPARLTYKGQADFKGTLCYRYDLTLEGQTGQAWFAVEGRHIVCIEHPYRDNPTWESFKLELLTIESMTKGDWNRYILEELERAQTYEG